MTVHTGDSRAADFRAADFQAGWRTVLTGAADTPLVLLGNFEVENQWADGEIGLPHPGGTATSAVVQRMDELALLLGTARDVVVLKGRPDEEYLAYLAGLGFGIPRVLTPQPADPARTVTGDVLADRDLMATLARLAPAGDRLAPHGVSESEERLSARSGVPLAAPPAVPCQRGHSQGDKRGRGPQAGAPQPPRRACRTLGHLADAVAWARRTLATGRPVVGKDAFGVSGQG